MSGVKNQTAIKNLALGRDYDLSLAIIDDREARRLNRRFLKKNHPANVLSFSFNRQTGEILINGAAARREAKERRLPVALWRTRLFIHGLLHLKGFRHGSKMENAERKLIKQFYPHASSHRRRPGSGHLGYPDGRLHPGQRLQGAASARPSKKRIPRTETGLYR